MAENIFDYIEKNKKGINAFQQVDIDWIEHYKKEIESTAAKNNKDFTKAINLIKRNTPQLNRKNVRDYYSDDIYNGFIATILWGHIFAINLRRVIACSKEDITEKIKRILENVNENPSKVFQNMKYSKSREYHIDGINVSFFTKIFYFTSHIHGNTDLLILDKKMWDAYNAFQIAKGYSSKLFRNCTYSDYKHYCNYMCSVPGIEDPERLEAFLFEHNSIVKTFLPILNNGEKSNPSDEILLEKNEEIGGVSKFSTINEDDIRGIIHDVFIIGFRFFLDKTPFILFVAHKKGKTGYFCEIRNCIDVTTDIMEFDYVCDIITKYNNHNWEHRRGNPNPNFRYVEFGNSVLGKKNALYLMKNILKDFNAPDDVIGRVPIE